MSSEQNELREAVQLLQDCCHQASLDGGWWKKDDTENPLMFSNKLALIHSELSEALEADRKNLMDSHLPNRHGTEVELADAAIRLFDLAGAYGMDLAGALVEKLAYNQVRVDHRPESRGAAGGKRY